MNVTMLGVAAFLSSVFLCGGGGKTESEKKKEPEKVEMIKKAK